MTSGAWKKRGALLATGAAVFVMIVWLLRPDATRSHEQPVAAAPDEPETAAHHVRRDFPSHPDPEQPSAKPDEAPAPTGPTAFATPPAPPTEIPVGDSRPPASRRSGASWALEYRDAICACSTRTCVRDLQGAFIHRLEAVDYDDERDGRQYSQATRAAVRCYTALPEDT